MRRAEFLFLVVSVCALVSCGGAGGTGGSNEAASPMDGEEGAEGAEATLETGGPVDIPVPVAKSINGIDPTSVRFQETDGSSNLTSGKSGRETRDDAAVGVLFASTIDKVEGDVAMIKEGNIVDTQATSDGDVDFDISESLLDVTLALVVYGTGENEGAVSPPVLVRISKSKRLTVAITNLGSIQSRQISVSASDLIAFATQTDDGADVVGTVSVRGGAASVLTSDIPESSTRLLYNPDGILTAVGASSGLLYFVETDGATEEESTASVGVSPGDRFLSISPDGLWFLSNAEVSGTLRGYLASFDDPQSRRVIDDADSTVARLQMDWMTGNQAVVIKELSGGRYEVQLYSGLSQVKSSSSSTVKLTTLFSSLTPVSNPQAESSGKLFVYECGDSGGGTDLCQSDLTGDVSTLVDGQVSHPQASGDDRYVVYGEFSGSSADSCDHQIRLYDSSTGGITDLATGCFPFPHPQDTDLIAYLSPFGDTLQVGLVNLDNFDLGLPASQLVLTGSESITAGSCNRYLVNTVDSSGNSATVTGDAAVNLDGAGNGAFYSDANCTLGVTAVVIAKNQNSAAFYYKGNATQKATLTTSASGLTSASISLSVTFSAPTSISLSGPATLTAESCSSAYSVTTKNTQGETTAVAQDTQVTLSGAGNGLFYSDSGCSSATNSITIATGNTSATFYYKNNQAESVTLTASVVSLPSASLSLTIKAATATKLVLSGGTLINHHNCNEYTVTSQDKNGKNLPVSFSENTSISLSSNSDKGYYYAGIYLGTSCTDLIASMTSTSASISLPAGQSSVKFYVGLPGEDPTNNPFTLTVSPPTSLTSTVSSSSLTITSYH